MYLLRRNQRVGRQHRVASTVLNRSATRERTYSRPNRLPLLWHVHRRCLALARGPIGSADHHHQHDPSTPATIKGRFLTLPGGDWWTFTQLRFDGTNSTNLPSPTIGSDHVTFSHDDITDNHTAICST